jgi:hypothetical protein
MVMKKSAAKPEKTKVKVKIKATGSPASVKNAIGKIVK